MNAYTVFSQADLAAENQVASNNPKVRSAGYAADLRAYERFDQAMHHTSIPESIEADARKVFAEDAAEETFLRASERRSSAAVGPPFGFGAFDAAYALGTALGVPANFPPWSAP